jgi:hypothetical protein
MRNVLNLFVVAVCLLAVSPAFGAPAPLSQVTRTPVLPTGYFDERFTACNNRYRATGGAALVFILPAKTSKYYLTVADWGNELPRSLGRWACLKDAQDFGYKPLT